MSAEPTKKSVASPTSGSKKPRTISTRISAFVIALLILVISTLVAFTQDPRPNPLQPVALTSVDYWRYPYERNAYKRLPAVSADLKDVFVLPGTKLIWAVGTGGMILHSEDGGLSWIQQKIQIMPPQAAESLPFSFGFVSQAHAAGGAAVSKDEYLKKLEQQEILKRAREKAAFEQQEILNIARKKAALEQQVEKLVKKEPPLVKLLGEKVPLSNSVPDPGATVVDLPIFGPEIADLSAVYFSDKDNGWIVGEAGLILKTTDGGNNWQPKDIGAAAWLSSVNFFNEARGWAVGANGTILRTTNGGDSWLRQKSGTRVNLNSVYFIDSQNGWAAGDQGRIYLTSDGGVSWTRKDTGVKGAIHSVYFVDAKQGWAAGERGAVLHSSDGGATWKSQTSNLTGLATTSFFTVRFTKAGQGLAVGSKGTILRTADGGKNWTRINRESGEPLTSVSFAGNRQGWAVGKGGTVLQTVDAGNSWQPRSRGLVLAGGQSAEGKAGVVSADLNPYRRYPAPWYYLSWLIAGAFLLPAIKRPEQIAIEQKSVADMLVSDKPLEAGEPDALNFGLIARSLSRYLRNESTQPPLTIAITGEWGTGKSSMMNLLKADLQQYGVRPVWFNAWHHQKESNLLASLLDNIRNQAVPDWWSLGGVNFRLRLLLARGWRNCLPVLSVLFVFAVSAGFVVVHFDKLVSIELSQISLGNFELIEPLLQRFPILTLSASSLALFIAVFKGFIAFGLDPKKLIPTIPGRLRIKSLNVELSFRQKFSQEFKDVTRALQPHTMLILIDDLDRCKAEHVLEILETINYLVSSGECYVVLGMARERVERCIGSAFKEVAEDMIDDQDGDEKTTDNGRKKRVEFARQYLEKLINIEVPVPVATPGQSFLLLAPETPANVSMDRWKENLKLLQQVGTKLLPWVLVVIVAVAGFWFGSNAEVTWTDGKGTGQQQSQATTDPSLGMTEEANIGGEENNQDTSGHTEKNDQRIASVFAPGQSAVLPRWIVLCPILLLMSAGIVQILRRPDYKVQDSPEFIQALKIWHPVIAAKRNTPRSIKRFLNRVRYFAMINRDVFDQQSKDSLLNVMRKTKNSEEGQLTVGESTLVVLGALHHVHPNLIIEDQLFLSLSSATPLPVSVLKLFNVSERVAGVIMGVLKEHESVFGPWSCSEYERAIFLEISNGIQIH